MRDMPMTTDMDLETTTRGRAELTGYAVEAIDGEVGSVDESTYEASGSYLVVDTGPWIFRQEGDAAGRRHQPHRHHRAPRLRQPHQGSDPERASGSAVPGSVNAVPRMWHAAGLPSARSPTTITPRPISALARPGSPQCPLGSRTIGNRRRRRSCWRSRVPDALARETGIVGIQNRVSQKGDERDTQHDIDAYRQPPAHRPVAGVRHESAHALRPCPFETLHARSGADSVPS